MNTYTFHHDAGHEWLSVPLSDLNSLGIANLISEYSYKNSSHAFLEGDCDAPIFVEALEKQKGIKVEFIFKDDGDHSPIRNYPRF